jgi:hypothetical protein
VSIDFILPVALILLPLINWPVFILLARATRRDPTILSLRERTGYAFIIAACTSIYVVITINAEMDFVWFTNETGRVIVRFGVLIIGLYPIWWLWSYYTNRFR